MPELAVRVRYRVCCHTAARAVAHAPCRLCSVLLAGRIVVGNIVLKEMPELAVRVRYRVRFRAAARAVAHALCRLGAVLFAGGVVVGNILLPCKAVVQGGDILGFCMGGAGAGVSPDPLSRAGGGRRHRAAVPYKVSGGIGDRLAGSSRHGTAGGVIFDCSTGVQLANIRLHLCAVGAAVVAILAAVADACARSVMFVFNAALHLQLRIAGNGDIISISITAAADACACYAADGLDLAAGDGNVLADAVVAAADACAVFAAGGLDLAAGDGDVAAIFIVAATDACAVLAALCGQLAVLVLVPNGQAAAVVLFKAGMLIATPERASAVQLDADIALAGGGNGGLALRAHVDVCAGEGDVCGLILIRVDGDGVFRGASRNDGGAVRNIDLRPLGDRLPAAPGVYGDVAVADVPLRRQRRHGQAGKKQQRKER